MVSSAALFRIYNKCVKIELVGYACTHLIIVHGFFFEEIIVHNVACGDNFPRVRPYACMQEGEKMKQPPKMTM